MQIFSLSKEDLEETADSVKVIVVKTLVAEKKISASDADQWCKTHTLILRKKNIFRTISNLWDKTEDSDGLFFKIVREP